MGIFKKIKLPKLPKVKLGLPKIKIGNVIKDATSLASSILPAPLGIISRGASALIDATKKDSKELIENSKNIITETKEKATKAISDSSNSNNTSSNWRYNSTTSNSIFSILINFFKNILNFNTKTTVL